MERWFVCPPVYDRVFTWLSPRSLFRAALTCRGVYSAVADFKARAFNINRHLSRYFTDPITFRSLQAKTNTLISGSNALQFLDRTFYPEADLDLYTHPGHSFEVAQFLVEAEGYYYDARAGQKEDWKRATAINPNLTRRRVAEVRKGDPGHAYPTTGIVQVWTFSKEDTDQGRLIVQIIEALSSPLEAILGFHSTCVMNFISSDAAYSLYPTATFENRSALGMPSAGNSPSAIRKYVRRGWRVYFLPTPDDSAFFLEQPRWVSDAHTWRLPLDPTGVKERTPLSPPSAPLTCDPALFNGWKMTFYERIPEDIDQREVRGYKCDYYPLKTTLFRYNYAIPDEAVQLAIREWAFFQGRSSHEGIPDKDWVWFDADVPSFLRRMKAPGH